MGQSPPGKSYNSRGKGLPFFQGKADFGERFPSVRVWCSDPRRIANAGDVLLSVRAPVGPTNIADRTCAIGRGLAAISPKSGTISEYIFFALHHIGQELALRGTGSTFSAISKKDIEQIEIDLPPLGEQKRIVAKIEELLPLVNAVRERLIRVKEIMKRFRQSVLSAACSGRVTEDWRQEEDRKSEWIDLHMADIGVVSGGITKNSKRRSFPLQVPYLRVANVYENELRVDDVGLIGITQTEFERTLLRKGDLLFVEGNGSLDQIGRVALWDNRIPQCVHQNHLIKFRPSGKVDPTYVLFWMMSRLGRTTLVDAAVSTAGLYNLSISKVENLPIMLPSLEEQKEIVHRVEALFKLAEKIDTHVEVDLSRTEKMTQAILAKAFRGELVRSETDLSTSR
jgi:type I restriction enzyme S subunit